MRVVHLVPTELEVPHDRGGAVQRRAVAMAIEQANRGHQVTLISPGGQDQSLRGVEIVAVKLRSQRPARDIEYLLKARRILRSLRPDAVHVHGLPLAAMIIGRGNWKSVHTVDFFYYSGSRGAVGRLLFGLALARFDATVPVSEYCRSELLEYHRGLRRKRVEVIYNGVDLAHFRRDPAAISRVRRKFRLEDYILYVGRVNEQKGCGMLPELAERLPAGTQLVVAGPVGQFGADGTAPLVEQIRRAGGLYLGAVAEEDLPALMAGATLLVLPTRRFEMFGMVLVEAGACGVPAVASQLGGIPEALGDGGRLFTPGDSAQFVATVNGLLSTPQDIADLSEFAEQNAQRFSWSRIVDDYEMLIKDVTR